MAKSIGKLLGAALIACLLGATAAWAASSVVTSVQGVGTDVYAAPYSNWLAMWTEVPGEDEYQLLVINDDNGKVHPVTRSERPGGMCWIPEQNTLYFTKGSYIDDAQSYIVTYYVYDPATPDEGPVKIERLSDASLQVEEGAADEKPAAYMVDPVAATDGSVVFHMTIGEGLLPSFNVYYPWSDKFDQFPQRVKIGMDYDLSSDGSLVYWYLVNDPEAEGENLTILDDGDIGIVGFNLQDREIKSLVTYYSYTLPVDGGYFIRVDSQNQQVAFIAQSSLNDRIQMCLFRWDDVSAKKPIPVFLEEGDEILVYDWKGISGKIYAVVYNHLSAEFTIEEINPLTSMREVLHRTTDEIAFVSYNPGKETYYFAAADGGQTRIIRVTPD
jgi:hypothetical protein